MNEILKYISEITNEGKKYQLDTTYKTLLQVDEIIKYYVKNTEKEHAAVVIDIYGLLQSLFVGIDSLYSLTIGITSNKFYINVNQNKTLNGLKHIRNDIVGHPTNRRYGQNGIGYSIINMEELTYNEFKYMTYVFIDGSFKTKETNVNLLELTSEYDKEKTIIIDRLGEFLNKEVTTINLDEEIKQMFLEPSAYNLDKIKDKFIANYGNLSNHRFMWRLSLVELALEWNNEDPEINNLIKYVLKMQVLKLWEIANDMENKYSRLPYVKIPYLLKKLYKYLDKNPNYTEYIKNLYDSNNPYFESDLEYLLKNVADKSVLKLLNMFDNETNNSKIYLLGATLKNYKKK